MSVNKLLFYIYLFYNWDMKYNGSVKSFSIGWSKQHLRSGFRKKMQRNHSEKLQFISSEKSGSHIFLAHNSRVLGIVLLIYRVFTGWVACFCLWIEEDNYYSDLGNYKAGDTWSRISAKEMELWHTR